MDSPTKRWREGYQRFDRRLGFVLGAVVGFALLFFATADGATSSREPILAGLVGAAVLGLICALFGDKVLWAIAKLLS